MSWQEGLIPCSPLGLNCVVDWGTAVSAGIGVVSIFVAFLAWRTSREATRIAKQQHDEIVRVRLRNGRVIGRLLLHEISNLPHRLESNAKMLAGAAVDDTYGRPSGRDLLSAVEAVLVPLLPNAEKVEERIHNLPNNLSADLATLISHVRDISAAAGRIKENIQISKPAAIGQRTTIIYEGPQGAVGGLLAYIRFVEDLAKSFRIEFRTFVLTDGAGESVIPLL
ncbi:hypothetical protein [Stenotrophomonas indicatrix]|uniref:hypothetical protein n=1 Tax=Stenotrophomonas indicatrix TaxID=2045451 RepID=UPI000FD86EED|nr:hypothetical protein [Stenotrophomonas indicatrix]